MYTAAMRRWVDVDASDKKRRYFNMIAVASACATEDARADVTVRAATVARIIVQIQT